jgi:hypothetical protein
MSQISDIKHILKLIKYINNTISDLASAHDSKTFCRLTTDCHANSKRSKDKTFNRKRLPEHTLCRLRIPVSSLRSAHDAGHPRAIAPPPTHSTPDALSNPAPRSRSTVYAPLLRQLPLFGLPELSSDKGPARLRRGHSVILPAHSRLYGESICRNNIFQWRMAARPRISTGAGQAALRGRGRPQEPGAY